MRRHDPQPAGDHRSLAGVREQPGACPRSPSDARDRPLCVPAGADDRSPVRTQSVERSLDRAPGSSFRAAIRVRASRRDVVDPAPPRDRRGRHDDRVLGRVRRRRPSGTGRCAGGENDSYEGTDEPFVEWPPRDRRRKRRDSRMRAHDIEASADLAPLPLQALRYRGGFCGPLEFLSPSRGLRKVAAKRGSRGRQPRPRSPLRTESSQGGTQVQRPCEVC
jgi:hypothetical protein